MFLLALGFFRLGFLDNMLARPLLCGLINAVAFVIILEQTVRVIDYREGVLHLS